MNKQDNQHIIDIIKLMTRADKAYWDFDTNNIMKDGQYETLEATLKQFKQKYPHDNRIIHYFSIMHHDRNNSFKKVRHHYHVISLAKVRHPKEVQHFLNKWTLDKSKTWYTDGFLVQPKQDGLSIVFYFNDPKMPHKKLTVLTRGSGVMGNDITKEAYYFTHMNIKKILKRIGNRHVVIRGEGLISRKGFQEDRKQGNTFFKNERNLVSGTIGNKDPRTVGQRHVFVSAYTLLNRDEYENKYPTELQQMKFMNQLGLYTTNSIHYFPNTKVGKNDLMRYLFDYSHEQRLAVGHDIDGLVIKPNYTKNFDKIGWNEHNPLYAVAMKFLPQSALTRIKTIRYQESAMGKLTPVLIFSRPVNLFGATISKATGASIPTLKKNHILINGYVTVKRMNDVIPKAFGMPALNETVNNLKSPASTLPQGAFRKGPFYYLHVNKDSMPVILNRWKKFVSKPCLNIMGLSDKMIKTMITSHLINPHDFSSLWRINHQAFVKAPGFAEKGWQNLQKELSKVRKCPLSRVLLGLPINDAGLFVLKPIAQKIGNISPLLANLNKRAQMEHALISEMPNIKGHGSADIPIIKRLFSAPIIKQLQNLSHYMALIEPVKQQKIQHSSITGMNFCITGALTHPRKYYKSIIEQNGAHLKSGVSGTTNYLICNHSSSSSKYRNAVKKHVTIINEKQFNKLLK